MTDQKQIEKREKMMNDYRVRQISLKIKENLNALLML